MSAREQVVMGSVFGDIAGRDVVHHTTVAAPPLTESLLQVEFAQRTGIWCSKPARQWLEYLLDKEGFTVGELRMGWQANSIGWSADKNARVINVPRAEAVFIYLVLGLCSFGVIEALIRYFSSPDRTSLWPIAALACEIFLYCVFLLGAARYLIAPRQVALRVRRCEERFKEAT